MPRGYSHSTTLLSGALASSSHQQVSPQSCWGSLLKPPRPSSTILLSATPLQEIRPDDHLPLQESHGRGWEGVWWEWGGCFSLDPCCLISILATCSYLILHK